MSSFIMCFLRLAIATLLITLTGIGSVAYSAECENPARLRFSLIPQGDVQKDLAALQPLFNNIQKSLGVPVEVSVPSSYGAVIEALLSGEIDFARLGPAAYVSARKQDPTIHPFASPSSKSGAQHNEQDFYYSVLAVNKDSPYNAIESLRGRKILLVDPDSTSGGLIPRHVFSRLINTPLDRFFGQVGYSGSHDRSIENLLKKQADAVFVSSMALRGKDNKYGDSAYRILWQSKPIPRDPFVLRGRLCANIKKKIVDVFMPPDGSVDMALMQNLKATHFVPVRDADFQILRELP